MIQSGFWHQFALTAHSPVGLNPEAFKISIPNSTPGTFALNDLEYEDPAGCNHEQFGEGLSKSLFNFMHGIGFDFPLQDWFDFKIPHTSTPPDFIAKAINGIEPVNSPNALLIWLGRVPTVEKITKVKKGVKTESAMLTIRTKKTESTVNVRAELAIWLVELLEKVSVHNSGTITYAQIQQDYEQRFSSGFDDFWKSKTIASLREAGLLTI